MVETITIRFYARKRLKNLLFKNGIEIDSNKIFTIPRSAKSEDIKLLLISAFYQNMADDLDSKNHLSLFIDNKMLTNTIEQFIHRHFITGQIEQIICIECDIEHYPVDKGTKHFFPFPDRFYSFFSTHFSRLQNSLYHF